jgi:predicted transcriptional regulator
MANLISQNTITIFPELANPNHFPRVMETYPYLSDTQVKIRVIEIVSSIFEDEMHERFTQTKLIRFLNYNRNNLFNIVEELMTKYVDQDNDVSYEEIDEEEIELIDELLRNAIINIFDDFINIRDWIYREACRRVCRIAAPCA